MLSIIKIFIAVIIIVISFLLFRNANGSLSLNKLSPLSLIYYYNLILLSFIGALFTYLGITVHPDLRLINNKDIYAISFFSVSYVLISLPLTIALLNKFFQINPRKKFEEYVEKPIVPMLSKNDKYIFYPFVLISILSLFITAYLLIGSPLLNYITGQNINYSQARILYSRDFAGSELIRNTIGLGFIPLCSYIAYSYMRMYRGMKWKIIFATFFINSLLIYGASMTKSGIASYLISFILLKVLIDGKIPLKQLLSGITMILIIVIGMYIATKENYLDLFSDSENLFLKGGPIGRIIFGQLVGFINTLNVFPNYHEFLYGADFAFLRFFGFEFVDSSRIVMEFVNPQGVAQGTAGVMNSLFIAEAYANFGYVGIVLAPIIVAFILYFFIQILYKLPKSPIVIGWWVYVMYLFSKGITGGFFSEFIVNTRIIIVTLLTFMLLIAGKFLYVTYEKRKYIRKESH